MVSVPQKEQLARARAAFAKRKRNRAVRPEHQIFRAALGGREEDQSEGMGERVDSTVKKDTFRGGEGGQARRVSLAEVKGTMSG